MFTVCVCVWVLQSMYKLWDDKWKLSLQVKVAFAVAQAFIFGFGIASAFVFKAPATVAAVLCTYAYVGVLLTIAGKWLVSGLYLSKPWRIGAALALGLVVVGGIAVGAQRLATDNYEEGIIVLSCAYLAVGVAVATVGLTQMRCVLVELTERGGGGGGGA